MVGEADEKWRESEESLELAVLEAARDEDRVKERRFCIGRKVQESVVLTMNGEYGMRAMGGSDVLQCLIMHN